jgi:dihydrofolate synthase/folylpolyglutamate synthase
MLASVLKAAGYKVGLYTSPFLQHYQERIRLNGVPLPDDLMVKYGNPLVEAAQALKAAGDFVTPFEMGTALAFAAFDGEDCDFAIIEVGMGGRLDPTNIITPKVCAITAIGLDHMGFLGDTLEEIAGEKAGIIKANTPVVCYPAQESVRRVFAEAAAAQQAPLIQLDESSIICAEGDMHGSTVSYQLGDAWQDMRINLPGQYQQRNAMTVLALVEELRQQSVAIPEEAVRKGLAETVWPARLEWAGQVLIDGAHNPQGVAEKLNALADRIIAIRGNCDSEVDQMLLNFPIMADYAIVVDEGKRLLLTHGHKYNPENTAHLHFDALFYGHTHVKELYKSPAGKIICNVGSVTFPKAGNPPSFAVYEAGRIKLVKV